MAEIDPAAVKAMLPRSLDDMIRANRDTMELGLANEDQLAPLLKSVAATDHLRGAISDWRFIAITMDIPEPVLWMEKVFLVGIHEGRNWITSSVKAIDRERMLVRTSNSVYRLVDEPGIGEPDQHVLMGICAVFNSWGWGPRLGLSKLFF